jgi:hypothetical protein
MGEGRSQAQSSARPAANRHGNRGHASFDLFRATQLVGRTGPAHSDSPIDIQGIRRKNLNPSFRSGIPDGKYLAKTTPAKILHCAGFVRHNIFYREGRLGESRKAGVFLTARTCPAVIDSR